MNYMLADFPSEKLQQLLEKETWNFIHALDSDISAAELQEIREKIKTIISILDSRTADRK